MDRHLRAGGRWTAVLAAVLVSACSALPVQLPASLADKLPFKLPFTEPAAPTYSAAALAAAREPVPPAAFTSAAAWQAMALAPIEARLALMPGVAAAKWQAGTPVQDASREAALLVAVRLQAAALGLDPAPVADLFALQMRLAREAQQRLHDDWRRAGFPAGTAVPDLARDLRPQIDRTTAEQLRALALAWPWLRDAGALESASSAGERPTLAALPAADRQALWSALAAIGPATATVRPVPGPARIRAAGVLRVGLSGDYAPFSLERDSALTGSDVVLARRLAAHLGVAVAFVHTSWPTLMADLQAGRFDVALGGVSVTPERAAVAAFSVPYHDGGKTFIAPCSAGSRFASLAAADQPGVRVIVNPGGTNERFVRSQFRRATVVVYPDNRGIFAALAGGAADLMVTDDVEVALQVRRQPTLCRATPELFQPASKAVLLPQDPALQAEVNAWLEAELREGIPGALLDAALAAPP